MIVNIIGMCRSETCWLGKILKDHPDIFCTIEKEPMFTSGTNAAFYEDKSQLKRLINSYKNNEHKNLVYADKTHPNIWNVEELVKIFSSIKFICISRNLFPTVSSMLKHDGVLKWNKMNSKKRFLGNTNIKMIDYINFSNTKRCFFRWLANENRISFLKKEFSDRILFIKYEDLISDNEKVLESIQSFLELDKKFKTSNIRKESLNKWKTIMNTKCIEELEILNNEINKI